MSALRTLASALCIVAGALLLATWAASTATLAAIEDKTVIEDATARAIATDAAQDALVSSGTTAVLAALGDAGFDTDVPGLEGITRGIIEAAVTSDAFARTVHSQTASIRIQVVNSLNEDVEAPIVVTLDFSDDVNARLSQIPVIGDSIPTIQVPGVPVQVMDAESAHTARATWDSLHFAKKWCGWLGLALVALGLVVSHRRRWYFAKLALAVGAIAAIVWAVLRALEPQSLAERLPGGGVADAIVVEIANHAKGTVVSVMGYVALGAMIAALVLFTLAARGKQEAR